MMYKEFSNTAVIAAKKEEINNYQAERKQLKREVLNGFVKGCMFLCVIYIICCLVFGLAADASTYDSYTAWRAEAENTALEHILNNNLYFEVWEAEDFLNPRNQDILSHRKDRIEIVEHTTINIAGRLSDGRFYGYDNIGQYIIVQKTIEGLKIGDMVHCWYCYANNNYIDDIESVYYIKGVK